MQLVVYMHIAHSSLAITLHTTTPPHMHIPIPSHTPHMHIPIPSHPPPSHPHMCTSPYPHILTRAHPHTLTLPAHAHPYTSPSVHPVELVSALREARSSGNDTKATRVLAGALKQLRLSRLKPDSTLNTALTSLAKEDGKLFNNPTAIEVQR